MGNRSDTQSLTDAQTDDSRRVGVSRTEIRGQLAEGGGGRVLVLGCHLSQKLQDANRTEISCAKTEQNRTNWWFLGGGNMSSGTGVGGAVALFSRYDFAGDDATGTPPLKKDERLTLVQKVCGACV